VSRREDAVVFFVETALAVDLEEGFKTFLVAGSVFAFAFVFVAAFAGLIATLGSLASFFTAVFFTASLVVSFLTTGFFVVVVDFVVLVVLTLDLDLVTDLAGAFLVDADLVALAGLFWSRY
jgi:hypothetical protein